MHGNIALVSFIYWLISLSGVKPYNNLLFIFVVTVFVLYRAYYW